MKDLAAQSQASRKILWHFFRSHKLKMLAVGFTMILAGGLESLNLAALYPIIHNGLNLEGANQTITIVNQFLQQWIAADVFVASCILLMGLTFLATAVRLAYHYLSNRLITDIIAENQKAIFSRFQSRPYPYFIQSQQGRLIYAGTVAPTGVSNNLLYVVRLANSLMISIFFIVLMLILSWQGTIFILSLGAVYIVAVKKVLNRIVNKHAHRMVEEDNKKNVILNEFITGIKTIMTYNRKDYWKRKYEEAVETSVQSNFKVLIGRILPDAFLKFAFFISIALIAIALYASFSGNILYQIPLLGTLIAVLSRLVPYANMIGNDIVGIARFMPDCRIVYQTLEQTDPAVTEGQDVIKDFKREIVFKDVRFAYEGVQESVLKGVNFSIEKNKTTAIVGASGAGKSTIVCLLLRLFEIQHGSISIDGHDLRSLKRDSYLSLIGYVSQETFIFNGTIKENIQFGSEASQEQVIQAAQLADAHEFIMKAPQGYDTIVGDSGIKLSGGQRQRIAIARALLNKPPLLIFDEATSSLDNISEKSVQQSIEKVSQNATVLVIAHRLSTVQKADKIIVLDKGEIVEDGTHQQLIERKKNYYQLYSVSN